MTICFDSRSGILDFNIWYCLFRTRRQHETGMVMMHLLRLEGRGRSSSERSLGSTLFDGSFGGEGVGFLLCFNDVLFVANPLIAEPI